MRHCINGMRDKVSKNVKRKQVNWVTALFDLKDLVDSQRWWLICSDYFKFVNSHPLMSKKRCAFYVLKTYYSTTAINYYRWFGEWQ